jgi:hypothetical protein
VANIFSDAGDEGLGELLAMFGPLGGGLYHAEVGGCEVLPDGGEVMQAADGHGTVGIVGLPPCHGLGSEAGVGLVPSVDEAVAGGVGCEAAAFVVKLGEDGGGGLNFFAVLEE